MAGLKTGGLVAIALIVIATVGAAECEQPTVAGCSLGMTLEQVKAVISNSSVTTSPDGTQLLTGATTQVVPSMKLGPNRVRVLFDRSGHVVEIWLHFETEIDEQQVLKAAEELWGKAESIHGADGSRGMSRIYDMSVSWTARCGATPQLNVEVTGPPWKSTVNMGLQRK